MQGTLRQQDDGWVLEASDGTQIDSGNYPLVEDDSFREAATEKLIDHELGSVATDNGDAAEHAGTKRVGLITLGDKPYTVADERSDR